MKQQKLQQTVWGALGTHVFPPIWLIPHCLPNESTKVHLRVQGGQTKGI